MKLNKRGAKVIYKMQMLNISNATFCILETANETHRPSFATWQKVYQPKAGVRLNPYSVTSPNARKSIAKSTRGHKVIVEIG